MWAAIRPPQTTNIEDTMIIATSTAKRLVKAGKATIEAECILAPDERGHVYQVVTRHDLQRVDHIKISAH